VANEIKRGTRWRSLTFGVVVGVYLRHPRDWGIITRSTWSAAILLLGILGLVAFSILPLTLTDLKNRFIIKTGVCLATSKTDNAPPRRFLVACSIGPLHHCRE